MQQYGVLGLIGVIVISSLIAFGIDRLLPFHQRRKRNIPIIGISAEVTNWFFAMWIVLGFILFVLSIAIAVLLEGKYERLY